MCGYHGDDLLLLHRMKMYIHLIYVKRHLAEVSLPCRTVHTKNYNCKPNYNDNKLSVNTDTGQGSVNSSAEHAM